MRVASSPSPNCKSSVEHPRSLGFPNEEPNRSARSAPHPKSERWPGCHGPWRGDSGFEHSANIAPGKFLELCGKLSKGSTVKWQFEAAAPLAFNIHYHQSKEVVFPAKLAKADRAQDVLNVPVDQDYCWMWSNKGNEAAKVKVQLQR